MNQKQRPDSQINKGKPKSAAERMREYRARKRQNKKPINPLILKADRKKMNILKYRERKRIAQLFALPSPSEQSSSQDQSVIHENNSFICGLLPSTSNILSQPNGTYNLANQRLIPMTTQPSQETILMKNGYGNINMCALWVPSSGLSRNEDLKEENPVNNSEEPQSTVNPNVLIKEEPVSDDEDKSTFKTRFSSSGEEPESIDYTNECAAYGKYIEQKLKNFSQKTRNAVQHAFSDIIYKASQRFYE